MEFASWSVRERLAPDVCVSFELVAEFIVDDELSCQKMPTSIVVLSAFLTTGASFGSISQPFSRHRSEAPGYMAVVVKTVLGYHCGW